MKTDAPSDSISEDEPRRSQLLGQCMTLAGKTWAAALVEEMSKARRSVEGGWPGTIAEARTLAQRELTRQLASRGLAPPSAGELASAAATVNEHARKEWQQAVKAERLARRGSGSDR